MVSPAINPEIVVDLVDEDVDPDYKMAELKQAVANLSRPATDTT